MVRLKKTTLVCFQKVCFEPQSAISAHHVAFFDKSIKPVWLPYTATLHSPHPERNEHQVFFHWTAFGIFGPESLDKFLCAFSSTMTLI